LRYLGLRYLRLRYLGLLILFKIKTLGYHSLQDNYK